ncbi:MAG: nucleotidyltransferase domain-containing protein [Treponema sp.]|nr:nucleotidyltransferase domain-containing protein [Treponema sp.]
MSISLPNTVLSEIIRFAEKYRIESIKLFGSRARNTNRERSDIDLFVTGENVDEFQIAIDEEAETLLKFDVIDSSKKISDELNAEIEKDGIVIYEKI